MRRNADIIKTAAGDVKGVADSVSDTNKMARGNLQTQISVLNDTTNTPPNPLAALGDSKVTSSIGSDDDQSYPGLEKSLGSQQELK